MDLQCKAITSKRKRANVLGSLITETTWDFRFRVRSDRVTSIYAITKRSSPMDTSICSSPPTASTYLRRVSS